VYLSSFVHREELFRIAERWFRGQPDRNDARRITEILIADGFIAGETLGGVSRFLLEELHGGKPVYTERRITLKGELRDTLLYTRCDLTPRIEELFQEYRRNPDFFYSETPINGVICLNGGGELVAVYRVKRPRRVAEKANRKIASWLFGMVQEEARALARERARQMGVPLEWLFTPEDQMVREFMEAEEHIAHRFSEGDISFDRKALTIHDVGGIKIVGTPEELHGLEEKLRSGSMCAVVDRECLQGSYNAVNLVLELPWDRERACKSFRESRWWERFTKRGLSEESLEKGLEALLVDPAETIQTEVILTTFPELVESELGTCIHEKRILAQRENRDYKGNIPLNIEFLVEYLFAVGFSPSIQVDDIPIKLWGRYLPDTLISHIRRLYNLPAYDLFY